MSFEDAVIQLIPPFILGLFLAVPVFLIAGKRRSNRWLWATLSILPLFGFIFALIFYTTSFISIFDRLNKLEAEKTFS